MKKLYSTVMMFAMMFAALSLTACGGDDDEVDNGGDASIVGMWECTYFVFDTDYPEMFDDNSGMKIGDRIRFKSDGTYETDYKSGHKETGRWSLNGNTLTVAENADISIPLDYKITKLTSTDFELTVDIGLLKANYKFKRVS